jgi:hypothetical protein
MDTKSSLKPALLGAAAGAVAMAFIGFTWGGWVTQSTSQTMAKSSAMDSVVAVLAPICLNQFQKSPDAIAKQAELKKLNSYDQGSFVDKAGWAIMPGATTADSAVAKACADLIGKAAT